jgi:hypothetical protein
VGRSERNLAVRYLEGDGPLGSDDTSGLSWADVHCSTLGTVDVTTPAAMAKSTTVRHSARFLLPLRCGRERPLLEGYFWMGHRSWRARILVSVQACRQYGRMEYRIATFHRVCLESHPVGGKPGTSVMIGKADSTGQTKGRMSYHAAFVLSRHG